MYTKSIEKLEFNKVKDILQNYAITYLGKQKIAELLPYNTKKDVKKALSETTEGTILLYRKGNPPICDIPDISMHLMLLENEGILSSKYILDLSKILKISRELKEYFNSEIDTSFAENLGGYFNNLYSNIGLEKEILSKIIDENTIDDKASSSLNTIRRNIRNAEQNIKNKLNSLLNSKYIQEPVITNRNGRFVIPVKNEYRGEIKGFIHDISASGSTVFIEPLSVFDINNEINDLKNEEKIEIEKILQELSIKFIEIKKEIENDAALIGIIDFIFAKAKYAKDTQATEPIISEEKIVNLINARHPLIDKSIVVANTITIGTRYNTLVITGPNTGGKTVMLKTLGLLCIMAMSGMHIPAGENSSIFFFDNIFADIGDEQSIANSVSTFSSHMINIVDILEKATDNSLILVDELGSGTDPIEGASLAVSILENLNKKNILTIATTHYSEVKHFALITDGFENASVEFDVETLSPTYKLLLGVPGTSNAFAISKKLGLDSSIIDRAKKFIDTDAVSIEELLKNIYDDKRIIEAEKEKILEESKEISILRDSLNRDNTELKEKEKQIIDNAKQKARDILIEAKEETDELIKEIEKTKDLSSANKSRNQINKKISDLKSIAMQDSVHDSKKLEDVNIGDTVLVVSLNQIGTVLSKPNKDKKVQVQIGNIKMSFSLSNLQQANKKQDNQVSIPRNKSDFKVRNISTEINVIGMNVEEAVFVIDKYLDDCILTSLNNVRIVHGKGTGALRKGIHAYLKKHPQVKSFRLGTFGEGEMGATIVELK